MKLKSCAALALSACLAALPASADDGHSATSSHNTPLRADGHAPIGVMGDHRHKQGEVMLSYRFMHMHMEGNQSGTSNIGPNIIATTVPNRFFGLPGQPPTLRIVPTEMTMDMHMLGAMYAPSDRVTLMVMLPYTEKNMKHLTYMGGAGAVIRGGFTTKTSGIGDVKLSALIGLMETGPHKLHLSAGLSLPTGSITETGTILTPTGATPTVRLPYAMQLGSGTYDLLPGITYQGGQGSTKWGAQLTGTIRLGSNDEGYSLGDEYKMTAWVSQQIQPWISVSGRMEAKTLGRIDGIDALIRGPVQTANPLNYGGETVSLFGGVNMVGQRGMWRGHRLAVEVGAPVHQDLNGVQMETDWSVMVGWQKAF